MEGDFLHNPVCELFERTNTRLASVVMQNEISDLRWELKAVSVLTQARVLNGLRN